MGGWDRSGFVWRDQMESRRLLSKRDVAEILKRSCSRILRRGLVPKPCNRSDTRISHRSSCRGPTKRSHAAIAEVLRRALNEIVDFGRAARFCCGPVGIWSIARCGIVVVWPCFVSLRNLGTRLGFPTQCDVTWHHQHGAASVI